VREPVIQVVPVETPPLLLLVGLSDITAIGAQGVVWRTARLCVDDLRVGTGGNLDGTERISLDPATGVQRAGRRLRDF